MIYNLKKDLTIIFTYRFRLLFAKFLFLSIFSGSKAFHDACLSQTSITCRLSKFCELLTGCEILEEPDSRSWVSGSANCSLPQCDVIGSCQVWWSSSLQQSSFLKSKVVDRLGYFHFKTFRGSIFYQRSDLNPRRLVEKHVRLPVCCAVLCPVVWLNTSKYYSC